VGLKALGSPQFPLPPYFGIIVVITSLGGSGLETCLAILSKRCLSTNNGRLIRFHVKGPSFFSPTSVLSSHTFLFGGQKNLDRFQESSS